MDNTAEELSTSFTLTVDQQAWTQWKTPYREFTITINGETITEQTYWPNGWQQIPLNLGD